MDKYVNSGEFDMNSFDAERVAFRESQEKAAKLANDPKVIEVREAARRKMVEAAERERRLQAADDLRFALDREHELFSKQEAQKYERQKEYEKEQAYQARMEKIHATEEAYKRYRKHSVFYRMFHKNIYKMKRDKMSVEEINQLYGGKTK